VRIKPRASLPSIGWEGFFFTNEQWGGKAANEQWKILVENR
jgi:hypothetical protein